MSVSTETSEQSVPENVEFPWNDMIAMTCGDSNRAVGICLNAIHEQLCVVADLLRIMVAATSTEVS